jgi:hypothetical protein
MERHNEAVERSPMDGLPDGAGLHSVVVLLCAVAVRLPYAYVNRSSRPVASESCHHKHANEETGQTGGWVVGEVWRELGVGSSHGILPPA